MRSVAYMACVNASLTVEITSRVLYTDIESPAKETHHKMPRQRTT